MRRTIQVKDDGFTITILINDYIMYDVTKKRYLSCEKTRVILTDKEARRLFVKLGRTLSTIQNELVEIFS